MAFDYLDKIGDKLGLTAQQIWPWFIRQQYIEAVVSLAAVILDTSVFIFVLRFICNHWRPDSGYSIYKEDHEALWIIGLFFLGVGIPVAHLCFWTEFFDIFNVEYAALKDILGSLS